MATVDSVGPPAGSRTIAIHILEDGFFCGVLGAGVVALWYLVLDTIAGRPLFTPSLLGSLLFQKGANLSNITIQPQVVFWYTAVHAFVFLIIGMIAAWLAAQFEKFPSVGIAMMFLFVIFETAFFAFALAIGKTVLGTLGLWTIAVANLLAAGAMAGYLWWKHPSAVRNMKAIWTAQE
jgi:hypothetical protein